MPKKFKNSLTYLHQYDDNTHTTSYMLSDKTHVELVRAYSYNGKNEAFFLEQKIEYSHYLIQENFLLTVCEILEYNFDIKSKIEISKNGSISNLYQKSKLEIILDCELIN